MIELMGTSYTLGRNGRAGEGVACEGVSQKVINPAAGYFVSRERAK